MSSNFEVQKMCLYCGKEFTARKTTTKTCSDNCAKRLYKARKRGEKLNEVQAETLRIKLQPIETLKAKEFLTVSDASALLNCSKRTIYRLISQNEIRAVNLSERKTIIRRSDIDKLFEQPLPTEQKQFDISECYTTEQVRLQYGISEGGLRKLIIRHNIPKFRKGWFAYVPKIVIDNLLSNTKKLEA